MFELKGNITICRLDSTTLETLEEKKTTNIVTKRSVELAIISQLSVFTNARRVAISTSTPSTVIDGYLNSSPQYNVQNLNNVIAVGFQTSDNSNSYPGVSGYSFLTSPNRARYHFRFPFTGSPRVFRTIGLVDSSGNNELSSVTLPCYAYTTLEDTVTQAPNEIIDIIYDISVSWAAGALESFKSPWEQFLFGQSGFPSLAGEYPLHSIKPSQLNFNAGVIVPYEESVASTRTLTSNNLLLKQRWNCPSSNTNGFKGLFYSGVVYGRYGNSNISTGGTAIDRKPTVLQNMFSHSANANTLYYDQGRLATSSLKPTLSLNNPAARSDDSGFPSHWSIQIKDSGGVGVGTYKFTKKAFFGQIEANHATEGWSSSGPSYSAVDFIGEGVNPYAFLRWDNDLQLLNSPINSSVLKLYHVKNRQFQTGSNTSWTLSNQHTTNTSNFFIKILAINSTRTFIYAASPTHGLYEVNVSTGVVTRLTTSSSYMVQFTPDETKVVAHITGTGFVHFPPGNYSSRTTIAPSNSFVANDLQGAFFHNNLQGIAITSATLRTYVANPFNPSSSFTQSNFSSVLSASNDYRVFHVNLNNNVITQCELGSGQTIVNWANTNGGSRNILESYKSGFCHTNSFYWSSESSKVYFYILGFLNGGGTPSFVSHTSTSGTTLSFLGYSIQRFAGAQNQYGYLNGKGPAGSVTKFDNSTLLVNMSGLSVIGQSDWGDSQQKLIRKIGTNGELVDGDTDSLMNFGSLGSAFAAQFLTSGIGNIYRHNLLAQRNIQVGPYDFENRIAFGVTIDGSSIVLVGHFSNYDAKNQLITGSPYQLESYGWNGTGWIKGLDVGKPIHTSTEPLLDGISVKWEELSPTTSSPAVQGQYYTQVIGDGILFDGYQSNIPLKYSYYFRDKIDAVIPNGTVCSQGLSLFRQTDSLFWRVDDDDATVHEILIDGLSSEVIFSGVPGPRQVLISSITGVMTFHSDDVGKTLSGTIIYVRIFHPSELTTATIWGTITSSANGLPVSGAEIYLNGSQQYTTGSSGLYLIPNVALGTAITLIVRDPLKSLLSTTEVVTPTTSGLILRNYALDNNPIVGDPLWSDVKLLLHFDSKLVSDPRLIPEPLGNTYTSSIGNIGSLSGECSEGYINTSRGTLEFSKTNVNETAFTPTLGITGSSGQWNLNSNNWCVEFSLQMEKYPSSVSGSNFNTYVLMKYGNWGTNNRLVWAIGVSASGHLYFTWATSTINEDATMSNGMRFIRTLSTIPLGRMVSYAIQKTGTSSIAIYIDGVRTLNHDLGGVWNILSGDSNCHLLLNPTQHSHYYGWNSNALAGGIYSLSNMYQYLNDGRGFLLDEIRLTLGNTPRYTSTIYTPPRLRFPDGVDASGIISGVITSIVGNTPLAGITVEITSLPSYGLFAITDSNGAYTIRGVTPSNTYSVTAHCPTNGGSATPHSYQRNTISNVSVSSGVTTTLNFTMTETTTPVTDSNYSSVRLMVGNSLSDISSLSWNIWNNFIRPSTLLWGSRGMLLTDAALTGKRGITIGGNSSGMDITSTSDWTLDCWVFYSSTIIPLGNNQPVQWIIQRSNSAVNAGWGVAIQSGILYLYWNGISSNTPLTVTKSSGYLPRDSWFHLAITRNGSTGIMNVFINGVVINSTTVGSFAPGTLASTDLVNIGHRTNGFEINYSALTEVRFTNGVIRYSGEFTPPITPWPRSLNPLGSISGTVVGPSTSCIVELLQNGSVVTTTETTVSSGNFDITGVPAGTYTLRIENSPSFAFQNHQNTSVVVTTGATTNLGNITLLANTPQVSDPQFASVSLLIEPHSNITRCDARGNTVSVLNSVSGSLSKVPQGGRLGLSYLEVSRTGFSVTDSPTLDLTSGSWTMEFWLRIPTGKTTNYTTLLTNSRWGFTLAMNPTTGALSFEGQSAQGVQAWSAILTRPGILQQGRWHHLAVTRNTATNAVGLYVDGFLIGSATLSGSTTLWRPTNSTLCIGGNDTTSNGTLDNVTQSGEYHLQEVRVTKGVCRYTGDFTPPSANFPNSVNAGILQGTIGPIEARPVTLVVEGLGETVTALNGSYSVNLPSGSHNLILRSISGRVENVEVSITEGSTTTLNRTLGTNTSTVDYFSNYVRLLAKFEGSNGAINIIEEKLGIVPVRVGTAQLSTVQKRFGSSSLWLDGSGAHLRWDTDYVFGVNPFTIEFWAYRDSATPTTVERFLIEYGNSTSAGTFALEAVGSRAFIASGTSVSCNNIPEAKWTHVAIVRNQDTMSVYYDGVLISSRLIGSGTSINGDSNRLRLGRNFRGYIDSLRITVGIARYLDNVFNPPFAEF